MAFTETTLASAYAVGDNVLVLASATGVAVGNLIRVDDEIFKVNKAWVSGVNIPVTPGWGGTAAVAHAVTAAAEIGIPTDWTSQAPGTMVQYPYVKPVVRKSYSATGAIALPDPGSDGVAVLNAVSTTVLAMTLADPTRAMDGCRLQISSRNGTGAHTITIAGGLNGAGASYNVFTFPAGPVMIELVALDLFWYCPVAPAITGTVTLLTGGIA